MIFVRIKRERERAKNKNQFVTFYTLSSFNSVCNRSNLSKTACFTTIKTIHWEIVFIIIWKFELRDKLNTQKFKNSLSEIVYNNTKLEKWKKKKWNRKKDEWKQ